MTLMMRMLCLSLGLLSAPWALASGSARAGAAKATTCIACHGPNGNSTNPLWPTLAGQNAAYIEGQLKHFKANSRINSNGVMMGMSAPLSDQDMQDLAAYFARQTPAGLEADPSYWKAGEAIYRGGDPSRAIPACMACHGPSGRGNPEAGYPALRAQHSVYLVKQLNDYASGARYSGAAPDKPQARNGAMMRDIAQRLTPEDIRNVASYLQGMR